MSFISNTDILTMLQASPLDRETSAIALMNAQGKPVGMSPANMCDDKFHVDNFFPANIAFLAADRTGGVKAVHFMYEIAAGPDTDKITVKHPKLDGSAQDMRVYRGWGIAYDGSRYLRLPHVPSDAADFSAGIAFSDEGRSVDIYCDGDMSGYAIQIYGIGYWL